MSVKSAERVLDIIEYLTKIEGGISQMGLSKELGIPKSSMSQLLLTMVNKGYLNKSEGNIYKLGHKLIIAGNKARTSNDIYSASIEVLRDAAMKTGETVFLAIRSADEIIYLAKVDSEDSARTTAQPGMRKPLHCTGLGKAFLSFESGDTRMSLLETIPLDAYTEKTITDREVLKKETAEYREQGYAIDDEENDLGVYCISAPIYGDHGGMTAAISCAGSKPRVLSKRDEIVGIVTQAAKEISETQGFTGGAEKWM